MKFALFLTATLPSLTSAYLLGDGHDLLTGCANIASLFRWANTDDCPQDIVPARQLCLIQTSDDYIRTISACAQQMADYANLPEEDVYEDLDEFIKGPLAIKGFSKAEKNHFRALFGESKDEHYSPTVLYNGPETTLVRPEAWNDTALTTPVSFSSLIITTFYSRDSQVAEHRTLALHLASGLMGYWGFIFVIRATVLFLYRFMPGVLKANDNLLTRTIRKYLILPPLLRFHHATPYRVFRYFTFQLPTRVTSLTVLGFIALNYILMFVELPGGANMSLYKFGYNWYLSSRSAQLVLMKLPLVFLFCGRNNFLLIFTGWSLNEFSIFHKWVGRITIIDAIIHGAAATNILEKWGVYSIYTRHDAHVHWGFASMAFMSAIFAQSIHWIRRLNYEFFKYVHVCLSIVFLATTYKHVMYSYYGLPYMYACWAVWIFDHLVRWTRILISGFAKASFVYHGGVLEITIHHSRWWQPRGGYHAFIHVLTIDKFWQSHPFSLMRAVKEGEQDAIKIIARAKDGITRDWVEKCIKNGGSFDCRVLVDGPYGTPRNFKFFDELVFIAGGIGISSPYAYLQNKVRRDTHQMISLYWGIPNEEPLTWFSTELEYLANSGKFTIHIFVGLDPGDNSSIMAPGEQFLSQFSDTSMGNEKDPFKTSLQGNVHFYSHQMDVPAIITDHIINSQGPTAFLTCGPADMNDTSRLAFVSNFEKSRYLCEHFEEHFSW